MIEPTIYLGPPGCGKTTALLNTVDDEMNNGVPPDRIGFMTFTRRGVNEAVTRASEKFMLSRKDFKYFNTLHSAAFRHLSMSSNQVFTGKKIFEFGRECGFDLRGQQSMDDGTYNSFYGDDLILFLENFARVTGMPVSQVLANNKYDVDEYNAWRIIHAMYDYKKTHDLLDFTDMIQRFIDKDDPPRLEVLIIDEAQDLSNQQWLMVEILARHVKRLYIAGDDDQTIFTWAGASKKFISMPGKVILLKQSYRVPKVVHKLANRLIKQVLDRREKDWNPRDATGTFNRNIIDISEMDPAFVKSGSIMMLGRTVKLLKKRFVPYCKEHGLLYKYFDASSIKSAHATAIKGWQKLQRGESIPASDILKIYDLLPSESHVTVAGVKHGGKTQLNRIAEQPQPPRLSMSDLKKDYGLAADGDWSRVFTELDHRDVAYIKKVMQNGYDLTDTPQIHLSTIHRVKGGQADKVIMLSDMSKSSDRLNVSRDEETRVYYTGITRTYEDLVVLQPTTRTSYDEIFE